MNRDVAFSDLAGDVCFNPGFLQTKTRIHNLIDHYLALDVLCDSLEDLPEQFLNPQPRPWDLLNWHNISQEQILGIDVQVFIAIIKGALDTEAPIRGYTQASRQYLQTIHPAMAKFVGGTVDQDNSMVELGLWEKEERQHTPALIKIYQQLTQQTIIPDAPSTKIYMPSTDPKMDLYHHGIHRIATEYSAVCLYLWLMARTTYSLQQVLKELLQDEINHMTKFWGFGQWLYSDAKSIFRRKIFSANNYHKQLHRTQAVTHLTATIGRMMGVLNWESWSLTHKIELIYTFTAVLQRMRSWSNGLSAEYLNLLFASSLIADNDVF